MFRCKHKNKQVEVTELGIHLVLSMAVHKEIFLCLEQRDFPTVNWFIETNNIKLVKGKKGYFLRIKKYVPFEEVEYLDKQFDALWNILVELRRKTLWEYEFQIKESLFAEKFGKYN